MKEWHQEIDQSTTKDTKYTKGISRTGPTPQAGFPPPVLTCLAPERGGNAPSLGCFKLTFRPSALDYPRISFGAKLRGAVRYRRSSARWLDAVTERQLP